MAAEGAQPAAVGALNPGSSVKQMRQRLKELRAPVYGTKAMMWERLVERERLKRHSDEVQAYLRKRAEERADAAEPHQPVA
eukprot:9826998-Lingulodinium_polyedra.AAC.1